MVALIFLCLNLVTSLRYELVINLKTAKALGLIVKREGNSGWMASGLAPFGLQSRQWGTLKWSKLRDFVASNWRRSHPAPGQTGVCRPSGARPEAYDEPMAGAAGNQDGRRQYRNFELCDCL
jgi:hypothetical protein